MDPNESVPHIILSLLACKQIMIEHGIEALWRNISPKVIGGWPTPYWASEYPRIQYHCYRGSYQQDASPNVIAGVARSEPT
jgi:hypothetical protein